MRGRLFTITLFFIALTAVFTTSGGKSAWAACNSPAGDAGDVFYNETEKVFQYCNDTEWRAMNAPGSGTGGCVNPTKNEGDLVYNADGRVLQGCAGNIYRPMGAVGGSDNSDWLIVRSAWTHTCGIKTDGTLWCWGDNANGQIGNNSTTNQQTPFLVDDSSVWKKVSTGRYHTCGIKSDDTLWCWGGNASGRTGQGITAGNTLLPATIIGGGTWVDVSAGEHHTCGIKSDDTLWCWGSNFNGRTGLNTAAGNALSPTEVNGGGPWKMVSSGMYGTCGIKSDDTLWCWGWNNSGEIGDNTKTQKLIPTAVNGGGTWKYVHTSLANTGRHTCGIKTDDTLWCWGNNSSGMLGDNSTTERLVPTEVNGGGTWKSAWGGDAHTCATKSDDSLWCWGRNASSQLGDNTLVDSNIPVAVAAGGTWISQSAGFSHSCGVKTNGSLYCWGLNSNGELGNNIPAYLNEPRGIYGGGIWKYVDTGTSHTCGIKSDDTLWCWGLNSSGQLGDNSTTNQPIPTAISGGGSWKIVSAGIGHTCGIKSDDTLWCWGSNFYGQLGDNSTTSQPVPTQVNGGGAWKYVDTSTGTNWNHTCGIKSDDTLWCWGSNRDGRTGQNTTAGNTLTPTEIFGAGAWEKVSTGRDHTCGIKSDDTLWCWGDNLGGYLGDGTTTDQPIPTAISGGGSWKDVQAGVISCGIKSDDTLWCWPVSVLTPTYTSPGGDNFTSLIGHGAFAWCGLKGTGEFWCLDATLTAAEQLLPEIAWNMISRSTHTCGITTTGAMLCWGTNSSGQITATEYSAPYQSEESQPLCGSPAGKAGQLIYNSNGNVLQYCDGDGWVGINWSPP